MSTRSTILLSIVGLLGLIFFTWLSITLFAPRNIHLDASPSPAESTPPTATSAPSNSPTPSATPFHPTTTVFQTPEQATLTFYNWYTTCQGDPQTTCNFKSQPSVDADKLSSNIDSKFANSNPIICAQNPPQRVRTDHTTMHEGGTATVVLIESFGAGSTIEIPVDLEQEDNSWKIVNITCPRQ